MKTKKIQIFMIVFCTFFAFSFTSYASEDVKPMDKLQTEKTDPKLIPTIPAFENEDEIKTVEIADADKEVFTKMKKSKEFVPELSDKVLKYISKLENNIYAKFVEISEFLENEKIWKLENAKYPDTEDKKNDMNELELIDTGKRLSTSASVAVNDKYEQLKSMVKEFHSVIFEYLKFRYGEVLKVWLKELNEKEKKKNVTEGKSDVKEIKQTPFDEIWGKLVLQDMKYVSAYKELKEQAVLLDKEHLIGPEDEELNEDLEKLLSHNREIRDVVLKGTFRASWGEFGIGWIMFIFGFITLYGGLALTFILEFKKKKQ